MKHAEIRLMSKEDFNNMIPHTMAFYDENDTLKYIMQDIEYNHMVIDDILYDEFSSQKLIITIIVKEK